MFFKKVKKEPEYTSVWIEVGKAELVVTLVNGEIFTKEITGFAIRNNYKPTDFYITKVEKSITESWYYGHTNDIVKFGDIVLMRDHILKYELKNVDNTYKILVK